MTSKEELLETHKKELDVLISEKEALDKLYREKEKAIKEKKQLISVEEFDGNLLKQGDFLTILAADKIVAYSVDEKHKRLLDFAIRIEPYVYVFTIKDAICLTNDEWISLQQDR